jgi:ankyrin repeat protein
MSAEMKTVIDIVVYLQDDKHDFFTLAELTVSGSPNYFEIVDDEGDNIFHHMSKAPVGDDYFELEKNFREFIKNKSYRKKVCDALGRANNDGYTPLMLALENEHLFSALVFLESKCANHLHVNENGVSAADLLSASMQKYPEKRGQLKFLMDCIRKATALQSLEQRNNQFPIQRTCSLPAQKQMGGTCYAYGIARFLTNVFEQMFPELFAVSDAQKKRLEHRPAARAYRNCDFYYSDLQTVVEMLTSPEKCPIEGHYNSALVFFYITHALINRYGFNGEYMMPIFLNFMQDPTSFFADSLKQPVLSTVIDNKFFDILKMFQDKINKIDKANDNQRQSQRINEVFMQNENWIRNFPEKAIQHIENGNLILLNLSMVKSDMDNLLHYNRNTWNFIDYNNTEPLKSHAMVITHVERNPKTVTIMNSWGPAWGNGGQITITENEADYLFWIYGVPVKATLIWLDMSGLKGTTDDAFTQSEWTTPKSSPQQQQQQENVPPQPSFLRQLARTLSSPIPITEVNIELDEGNGANVGDVPTETGRRKHILKSARHFLLGSKKKNKPNIFGRLFSKKRSPPKQTAGRTRRRHRSTHRSKHRSKHYRTVGRRRCSA